MSDEAFPREQAVDILRRLPSYGRLAWSVGFDPAVSRTRRGVVLAAVAYLVSPIDAIPGIIPVVGQMDDMLVLVAAIMWALASMPPERRHQHLIDVGLSESVVAADLGALREIGRWAVGRAYDGARSLAAVAMSSASVATSMLGARLGGAIDGVRRRRMGDPSRGSDADEEDR